MIRWQGIILFFHYKVKSIMVKQTLLNKMYFPELYFKQCKCMHVRLGILLWMIWLTTLLYLPICACSFEIFVWMFVFWNLRQLSMAHFQFETRDNFYCHYLLSLMLFQTHMTFMEHKKRNNKEKIWNTFHTCTLFEHLGSASLLCLPWLHLLNQKYWINCNL